MINAVLRRLESLQAELATLDPSHEIAVAEQVAAMAQALRDVTAEANKRLDRAPGHIRRPARSAAA